MVSGVVSGQWYCQLLVASTKRKPRHFWRGFPVSRTGGALARYVSYFLTLTVGVLIFAESITTFGTATVVVFVPTSIDGV